jgi:hypothetical protein
MAVLTTQQRNTLETAVKRARQTSEEGAFNGLHSLAVDYPEFFDHLTLEQRSLRNRLRQKGRLLGDDLPATGDQKMEHLTYELAYETWHKMLFAKFLEANDLLIYADGVAVTMEDCEQLAKEEGFIDKWDAAATYASKMLPAIFRTDDPLMQVPFASNDRIKLEQIIDALDPSIFTADDALGWVYQFWQSQAKEDINKSGAKIDGAKLPAVTQLFTEPYMVHFLIDNTLGAWWVSRNPGVTPPIKFEYLRLSEDGTPAAGKFEGWPDKTSAVTSLDPCMGSGHFVASLFPVFATLRMYEEGLTKEEATDKVITENLHGLELDARCTQIAAFNLALTAWKFCGHYKQLPEMNLACSGIAPKGKVEDWVKLVAKEPDENKKMRMGNGMKMLYDHFQLAPELGSLLDPTTIKPDLYTASFEQLQPVLVEALEGETDKDLVERGVMAAGIAKAGNLLSQKYVLLITNVPYLQLKKQSDILANYVRFNHADSKTDLATVFIDRCDKMTQINGSLSIVSPANWISQDYYKKFRLKILDSKQINSIVQLGSGSFSQISGEVVKPILYIHSNRFQQDNSFSVLDTSYLNLIESKINGLLSKDILFLDQQIQKSNLGNRFSLTEFNDLPLLRTYANYYNGITTGDILRFSFKFWELECIDNSIYLFFRSTLDFTTNYGGCEQVLKWENGRGELINFVKDRLGEKNTSQWIRLTEPPQRNGIIVSAMGRLPLSIFNKTFFDDNTVVIIPKNEEDLSAIWSFCSSNAYSKLVREIDKSLKVRGPLVEVPFDIEYWQKVAEEKYPNGLPKPYSDDVTQWLFHGHPIQTESSLQVAVARMLGYRWPAESDGEMELADEARELIKAVKEFDHLTDEDGIFCIPSVNSEGAGADRLRSYLQEVFGGEWSNQTISQLLTKEGASSTNLDEWLRKEFFVQHCKVFQNRPFIWNIWDGRPDGFSALVNYHTLTKEKLSKLIYNYLGDWIRGCEAMKRNGESGAEGLLIAALKLKEKLEAILHGEKPFDIFVRWKPIEQQPIGWEPDLNDGVRLNIRPFVEAGVLRSKFNIKWGVDRGKNPPGSHWGEERDNDKHLTLAEKLEAREKQ